MNLNLWWVFLTTSIVLAMTPGPAVMLILASGLREGPTRTIFTILGILSANATYFVLSATSIGALLLGSYNIFFLVKWLGAAYLVYSGLRALWSGSSILLNREKIEIAQRSPARLFTDGYLLQISNPKALVYFAAVLPQFVDVAQPIPLQIAILGLTCTVSEFLVLTCYGFAAGRASAAAREPDFALWTNRIAGLLLIAAGTGIALLRK